MKFQVLTLCLLFWGYFVSSQNVDFDKSNFADKRALKEALTDIEYGDQIYNNYPPSTIYKTALKFYLKANAFNPDNALLNLKVGHCYLYSNEKDKAFDYLKKAYILDNNVDQKIHLLLGMAHHLKMEWDQAMEEYTKYKNFVTTSIAKKSKDVSEKDLEEVEKKIAECNYGKELVKNPILVKTHNLGEVVNSKFPEYGPKLSADESVMIFTSRREETFDQPLDLDGFPFEDLYISYNKNGEWTKPKNMGSPVNDDGHDASLNLSVDGQTLFIVRNEDLYECHLNGDKWSKPEFLEKKKINTLWREESVALSPDGNTLYFVSNREDITNYGGFDIFMCKKNEKGKWEDPVNLGPKINTKYNDRAIFLHPDGKTLYFSSDGHETMGGLDIFRTKLDSTGQWSQPVNMGYPINTTGDDIDLVFSANKMKAYYASAALGGLGEKDLYVIYFPPPLKPSVINTEDNLLASVSEALGETAIEPAVAVEESASLTILKGFITDALTEKPVEATIEIVDNEKNEVISTFKSNSSTGKYLISLPSGKNYGIAVKAEKYLFHSENFIIPEASGYQEIWKNIALKNVEVGSKIVLKNIFFDYDKATLRSESEAELARLTKLLNDVPTLKIEISGHTDDRGSDAYNQKLSEDRAKSVVEYLIKNGIDTSRLEYKGYGEVQPIASNDTDEGRQENRRTEFKILSK